MSAALQCEPGPRMTIRLRHIVAEHGLNLLEFAAELGIDSRSVHRWLYAGIQPRGLVRASLERWLKRRGHTLETALEADVADITEFPRPRGPRAATPRPPRTPRATIPEEPPVQTTSHADLEPADLAHFGLDDDPFDSPEDPEDVFLSATIKHIEKTCINAIRRWKIVAIAGAPGGGKSTIIRRLTGRARSDSNVRVIAPSSLQRGRITHAALGVAALRDLIGKDTSSYSMEARSELLRSTLADQTEAGVHPVLLIDEAHHLKVDALLAIKQLWDSHTLHNQLAVILVGQPQLAATLRREPAVRELTGRTRIFELPPMGEDTPAYLRWRFARVGADADKVFDAGAYKQLAIRGEYALWINNLAIYAMQCARGLGDRQVTAEHVGRV